MKIIGMDNFNREHISDILIAENVSDYWAQRIVKHLNEKYDGEHSPHFFKTITDHEKPYKFEP